MATLLKVLNNLADIKSAGGVALRVRTQGWREKAAYRQAGDELPVLEETLWRAFDESRRGEAGGLG